VKFNQDYVKGLVISHILKVHKKENIVVASEVSYLGGSRLVDLLLVTKSQIHSYEIKSDLDSLRKIKGQMEDYIKTFDKVIIVISKKFLTKPEIKKLPKSVGIYTFDNVNRDLVGIREPRLNKQIQKTSLSLFLRKSDLITIAGSKNKSDVILRKRIVKRLNLSELKNIVRNSLISRYKKPFNVFLKDCGSHIDADAVKILRFTEKNFLHFLTI
jgi:hypothetical protein